MKFAARTIVKPLSPEMLFPYLAFLMWFGVFLYYESGNFMFVSIASCISAACCMWLTIFIVRKREVNLIRLVAYVSMVWFLFPLSYYKFIDLTGMLEVTEGDIAGSVILITALLSIGWFFSFFLNFKVVFPRDEPAFLKSRDLFLVLFPLCIVQVLLMVTGDWSYDTTHTQFSESQLNPLAVFAGNVTPGIAPLVAYNFGLLSFRQRTPWQWLFLIAVLSLEGVFWLIAERRDLLMVIALSAIAFSLGRIKDKFSSRQILYTVVLAVPLGLGLAQANKLFYTLRLAATDVRTGGGLTQLRSLSDYLVALNNVSVESVSSELQKNMAARPYIIESVGIFQKYATGHLYGMELLYDIIRVIPSQFYPYVIPPQFYPNKKQFLAENIMPEKSMEQGFGRAAQRLFKFSDAGWICGFLICWFSAV